MKFISLKKNSKFHKVKTNTKLQMEYTECGAVSLGIILDYFGKNTSIEELRIQCGVSRDGSNAKDILETANRYDLNPKAYTCEVEDLYNVKPPAIIHWNFNHFVVFEGIDKDKFYINDPEFGHKIINRSEMNQCFTGIVLEFEIDKVDGKKKNRSLNLISSLLNRVNCLKEEYLKVIVSGIILTIPSVLVPILSQQFIDEVLIAKKEFLMMKILIILFGMMMVTGLLMYFKEINRIKLKNNIEINESQKLLKHILKLPLEFFSQRNPAEISNRMKLNRYIADISTNKFIEIILNFLLVIFYFGLMSHYSITLALISVFLAFVNIIFLKLSSKKRTSYTQQLIMEEGKFYATSLEGIERIEDIKATGQENQFFLKWLGVHANLVNSSQKFAELLILFLSIPKLIKSINFSIILILGSYQVMSGNMTLGSLVAFQTLNAYFLEPFEEVLNFAGYIQELKGYMEKVDDILNYPQESYFSDDKTHIKKDKYGNLEAKNITFGYSQKEEALIQNFNLKLEVGKQVAIIGKSGSGKSTISKLLMGLYTPWEGGIFFENINIRKFDKAEFYKNIAIVDQEIVLFEGSIYDNILLGRKDVKESDLYQAAKDACILEDILLREFKFEDRVEDNGKNFSGGQRQRIQIARALVGNPDIVILDEATSALDSFTEKKIMENLKKRGCICLIISHRLSIIRDCDEILVMDSGKVVERGTHSMLLEKENMYFRLLKNDL